MPNLPQLARVDRCPDCTVGIGVKHRIDCLVALCVMTGQARVLHAIDQPPPPAGLPFDLDVHTCGEAVWTGYPAGAVEAAAYGLFVRPADPADAPFVGWIPCEPGEPGAVPDLDRLVRSAQWNPIRQVFELHEVPSCG